MAIVKKPREVPATHYPFTLKYLVVEGEPPPQLTRSEELALKGLATFAWRVHRARRRKAAAEQLAERWRDKVLQRWPAGLYGMRVYNGHPVQVRVATPDATEPADNLAFLTWLGKHAPKVVNEFTLGWVDLLCDPRFYREFIEFIQQSQGREAARQTTIKYNRTKMYELIEEGQLPAIPQGMFKTEPGTVQRLLVEPIDFSGKVLKTPKPKPAA